MPQKLILQCVLWMALPIKHHIIDIFVLNLQIQIQTFINCCLRGIVNIWWPEKICIENLWQRGKQQPVSEQILRRKWGWNVHTLRNAPNNITRQALRWNLQGKRKRGHPRNSWRQDTDAELKLIGYNRKEAERKAQVQVRWQAVVDGLCSTWSDGSK